MAFALERVLPKTSLSYGAISMARLAVLWKMGDGAISMARLAVLWQMGDQQKMREHGNVSVAVFKEQPELPAPAKYQLRKE